MSDDSDGSQEWEAGAGLLARGALRARDLRHAKQLGYPYLFWPSRLALVEGRIRRPDGPAG